MSSYAVFGGIWCRMSAAFPCRMKSRCMAFSWAAEPLLLTTASNLWWNCVQDVDHHTSTASPQWCRSLHSFHLRVFLRASSTTNHILNFHRVASRYCQVASMSHVTCNSPLNSSWWFWASCLTTAMTPFNCLSHVFVTVSLNSLCTAFMKFI
jgi:hypothetical protein